MQASYFYGRRKEKRADVALSQEESEDELRGGLGQKIGPGILDQTGPQHLLTHLFSLFGATVFKTAYLEPYNDLTGISESGHIKYFKTCHLLTIYKYTAPLNHSNESEGSSHPIGCAYVFQGGRKEKEKE